MRREIATLSNRVGRQLIPTTFIHKHNGSPEASKTDVDFLLGPFVDQVSTAIAFVEVFPVNSVDLDCQCAAGGSICPGRVMNGLNHEMVRIESSFAFSLIITERREYRLYAARKNHCTQCRMSSVHFGRAQLVVDANHVISNAKLEAMRELLRRELAQKIEAKRQCVEMESIA
jgi:hypothetical protein